MVIRLVEFNLGKGRRAAAEAIADKLIPVVRAKVGCERAEFYEDDDAGIYGFIVLFSTPKDAADAYDAIFPVFSPAVTAAGAKGAPSVRTLPVYEPK